jgi:hypothetical protein
LQGLKENKDHCYDMRTAILHMRAMSRAKAFKKWNAWFQHQRYIKHVLNIALRRWTRNIQLVTFGTLRDWAKVKHFAMSTSI